MKLVRWQPTTGLVSWNPFRSMGSVQRDLDRVFGDLFGGFFDDDSEPAVWLPRVDILERDEAFVVRADLPGLTKDDVKINVEDDTLCIEGERKEEKEKKEASFTRVERLQGRFKRTFTLPKTANAEKIEARFKNGVLEIQLPKKEEAKARMIEVKEG